MWKPTSRLHPLQNGRHPFPARKSAGITIKYELAPFSVESGLLYSLGAAVEVGITYRQGQTVSVGLKYAVKEQMQTASDIEYGLLATEPSAASLAAVYSLGAAVGIDIRYELPAQKAAETSMRYELPARLSKQRDLTYSIRSAAGVDILYDLKSAVAAETSILYLNSVRTGKQSSIKYALEESNPSAVESRIIYGLNVPQSVVTTGSAKITFQKQTVPISSVTLHCDEDSVYWQCQIELTNASDYGKFRRDDVFTLTLFGTDYAMMVDARELSRGVDGQGNRADAASISALSPACRHASPRATLITNTWTSPIRASEAVSGILGESVTWDIIDWIIPAYRLAAARAAPLDLAKQIVGAAGGLLECMPDGTLRARYRFPVSIPNYSAANVDATLTERDIFSTRESPANDDLRNRFNLRDVTTSYSDRLEWTASTDSPRKGVIRAYPSPWRDTVTVTTTRGSPPVSVWKIGEKTTQLKETVEFTAGHGSTSKPVMSVSSVEWKSVNLGGVSFEPYTSDLIATGSDLYGYSMAEVTYITKFIEYGAECVSAPVDAQFLLISEK